MTGIGGIGDIMGTVTGESFRFLPGEQVIPRTAIRGGTARFTIAGTISASGTLTATISDAGGRELARLLSDDDKFYAGWADIEQQKAVLISQVLGG